MTNKNIGRPLKVDYKVINKLADALRNCASVTEACEYAGISRDTFYRYLNNEPVFAEKITTAKRKRRRAVMSFLTK